MTNQPLWVTALRYLVIGVIWLGALAFAIIAGIGAASGAVDMSPLEGIGFAAFVGVAVATVMLMLPDILRLTRGDGAKTSETAKPKNSDASNPMSLLTSDDLDELRAELREAMRSRIRRLSSEADFESFEQLLADAEPREHKRR